MMRTIPLSEVAASNPDYAKLAKLAEIFRHEIVEDDSGVWRWKAGMARHLVDAVPFYEGEPYSRQTRTGRGRIDLNELWADLHDGEFSIEEMMKFYMGMGYSLCGFVEIFGDRDAADFGLSETKKSEGDGPKESLVEYFIRQASDAHPENTTHQGE